VSLTSGGTRTPRAVTFGTQIDSAGLTTLWAIITTAEANSVYALAITPRAAPDAGEADFDVNLSQLAGIGPGGAATLITLPATTVGGPDRLATLTTNPNAGTVTLTDVLTATGRTLPLTIGLNRIVLFRGERGSDEALIYASNRSSSTFHVVDINAFDTGEFVFSLATRPLLDQMNRTSEEVEDGVDEFALAGLEAAPSRVVKAPRVAASPAALECKLISCTELHDLDGQPLDRWWVVGQVVATYVDDAYLRDGRFDTAAAQPLGRCGYRDYAAVDEVFELLRPTDPGEVIR
jgi:flavin reductase (DIM6/NTAB) family NADH-FMN oxidoreductase RutF